MDPIDNKSSWVQVMAWHCMGAKPLPEPMVTQSTHALLKVGINGRDK